VFGETERLRAGGRERGRRILLVERISSVGAYRTGKDELRAAGLGLSRGGACV
jgi:hypothetical protein